MLEEWYTFFIIFIPTKSQFILHYLNRQELHVYKVTGDWQQQKTKK